MKRRLAALAIALLCAVPTPVAAGGPASARERFALAYTAMEAGRVDEAWRLAEGLDDYVLAPWLEYRRLSDGIEALEAPDVQSFLQRAGDSYTAERLRQDWLLELGRRGDWEGVLEQYRPGLGEAVDCLHLEARSRQGVDAAFIEEALPAWLSASVPYAACRRAFRVLGQSPGISDSQRWLRIDRALARGALRTAERTAEGLSSADRQRFAALVRAYRDPAGALAAAGGRARDAHERRRLTLALERLARKDALQAAARWAGLRGTAGLDAAQAGAVDAAIALEAVRQDRFEAAPALLDAVPPTAMSPALERAMIQVAVASQDWPRLVRWTDRHQAEGSEALRWRYWRARALMLSGQSEAARALLVGLAGERDYYGFLAAELIGAPYRFDPAGPAPARLREALLRQPGFQRASELRAIGREREARREWAFSARALEGEALLAAAALADEWGWHTEVIRLLGGKQAYDALALRFPTPHLAPVTLHAGRRALPASTIYSIMRAESAFQADALSSAGALGLMQLMPATGAQTARRLGMPAPSKWALIDPETNIALGSAYFGDMLERFGGNLAMAAAAYNAGPGRVLSWQPREGCVPTEFWIETIPFRETHRYVRRILFYDVLYGWRLGRPARSLGPRTASRVPARDAPPGACPGPGLS